jgi:DNA helicase HerA-like ATPase
MYRYKMDRSEDENNRRKVMLTLEEAHGFISRDNKDKMEQTLAQLQRIARRGRKRWLALHFVTQSPQHLPAELFELANNKIIHQTTGTENLRVLKVAAGAINEGIWDDVPSLGVGRTVIVSSQYPYPIIARIRPAASRRNYLL